ncbi:rh99.1 [macacine betaherpesvirus 3]|uniref:Rh99.1 n=1 Tax=Rhesus cytomegalovirus (strain 68-1) TaxID=47929 RepID=Q2FAL5_RHCM6|nr:rh99.1 [macacine betaherpesvirus 3]
MSRVVKLSLGIRASHIIVMEPDHVRQGFVSEPRVGDVFQEIARKQVLVPVFACNGTKYMMIIGQLHTKQGDGTVKTSFFGYQKLALRVLGEGAGGVGVGGFQGRAQT